MGECGGRVVRGACVQNNPRRSTSMAPNAVLRTPILVPRFASTRVSGNSILVRRGAAVTGRCAGGGEMRRTAHHGQSQRETDGSVSLMPFMCERASLGTLMPFERGVAGASGDAGIWGESREESAIARGSCFVGEGIGCFTAWPVCCDVGAVCARPRERRGLVTSCVKKINRVMVSRPHLGPHSHTRRPAGRPQQSESQRHRRRGDAEALRRRPHARDSRGLGSAARLPGPRTRHAPEPKSHAQSPVRRCPTTAVTSAGAALSLSCVRPAAARATAAAGRVQT